MRYVMEGVIASVVAGVIIGQIAVAQRAPTTPQPRTPSAATSKPSGQGSQATLQEIERTLGFVPQFFRAVAEAHLPSFWQMMKEVQISETSLDMKTKELIGLAVASQIPCEFCVYFHTEAARHNGANDQQIREAISMAAMTRMASTVLNGSQIDVAQFRKDTQRLMKGANGKKQSTAAR